MRKGEAPTLLPTLSRSNPLLRQFFVKNQDEVIYKVILSYFKSISVVFAKEWDKQDSVLKKTIGFTALAKLMTKLIHDGLTEQDLSQEFFEKKLSTLGDVDFKNIQLSSKGVKQLLDRFHVS